MPDKNKYTQQIINYLSNLTNQRLMLYVATAGVTICLILVILGLIFPQGIPDNNPFGSHNPDSVVKTDGGVTSEYTANQVIDFVKSAIYTDEIDNPSCSTDQAEFTAFFSHRKYWKVSLLCPPEPANGIHYSKEYLYEFNEWDKTVKDTSVN